MRSFLLLFICSISYITSQSQSYQWTWIAGDSTLLKQPYYGIRNEVNPKNTPGNRSSHNLWIDENETIWLFGGRVYPMGRENYLRNDLWNFKQDIWTWTKGYKKNLPFSNYGQKNLPDKANTLGLRYLPAKWNDGQGNFWLYGGLGYDYNKNSGYLNDLWKWDGKYWMWIYGDSIVSQAPHYGKKGQPHVNNTPGSRYQQISCMDDDGNLWMYGGYLPAEISGNPGKITADLWKWDGKYWTWMGGDSISNPVHQFDSIGSTGTMGLRCTYGAMVMWYADGFIWTFGGRNAKTRKLVDHIYKWKNDQWIWVKGNPNTANKARYGEKGIGDDDNTPGPRTNMGYCQTPDNKLWIYGGLTELRQNYSDRYADLWQWDGENWIWISGDSTLNSKPLYGNIGVEEPLNKPGARNTTLTSDRHGNLFLYGGTDLDGAHSDLWKFGATAPFAQMRVYQNHERIYSKLDTPNTQWRTHFGSTSITSIGVEKKFVIVNKGNTNLQLQAPYFEIIGKDSKDFRISQFPSKNTVPINDSVEFTVLFKPKKLGTSLAQINIYSNDLTTPEFHFLVAGIGTAPRITLVNKVTCSSANLLIKSQKADHYTVLISNQNKNPVLVDGQNFNYSPNYARAPLLNVQTKILYQGPNNTLHIESLISNRQYFLWVIPGNGPAGNTLYLNDSAQVLSFTTPASIWQDSISIAPKTDSSICPESKVWLKGKSPNQQIRWMDGNEIPNRLFEKSNQYYFTCTDPVGCILSSDSIKLTRSTGAKIERLVVLNPKPWCKGDSIKVSTQPANFKSYQWSNGSNLASSKITESNWLAVQVKDQFGCKDKDSLLIKLNEKPSFAFHNDSTIFEDHFEVAYTSNATQFVWHSDTSSNPNYKLLPIPTDKSYLKVQAVAKSGCKTNDSILIRKLLPVDGVFPNAFTANGDGVNDVWFIPQYYPNGYLQVFDRWGGIVHSGANAWDGTKNGQLLPVGVYFFSFRANKASSSVMLKGKIQLMR